MLVVVLVVLVASLAAAAFAATLGLRGREPSPRLLQGLLALQLLLLVQAAVAVARLLGPGVRETPVFVGYLVASLVLLPGAFALTVDERNRYASLLLAVACLVVAVVTLRLQATA